MPICSPNIFTMLTKSQLHETDKVSLVGQATSIFPILKKQNCSVREFISHTENLKKTTDLKITTFSLFHPLKLR